MKNKYVLTYPWNEDEDEREKLQTKINEANRLWEELTDFGYLIEDNGDPLVITVLGIHYEPSKWVFGVSEEHNDSAYCITIECIQNPSAEDYAFEVSEEFFDAYIESLKVAHASYGTA